MGVLLCYTIYNCGKSGNYALCTQKIIHTQRHMASSVPAYTRV